MPHHCSLCPHKTDTHISWCVNTTLTTDLFSTTSTETICVWLHSKLATVLWIFANKWMFYTIILPALTGYKLVLLLPFNDCFSRWTRVSQPPLGSSFSLLHLVWNRTSMDYWKGFLWTGFPSWHPTISLLKETQSTTLTHGVASSFLHPPPDCWWKGQCCLDAGSPTPEPLLTDHKQTYKSTSASWQWNISLVYLG